MRCLSPMDRALVLARRYLWMWACVALAFFAYEALAWWSFGAPDWMAALWKALIAGGLMAAGWAVSIMLFAADVQWSDLDETGDRYDS